MVRTQVFKTTAYAADVAITLVEKRNFENEIMMSSNLADMKERALAFGIKVKPRRKNEFHASFVFQVCQGLSWSLYESDCIHTR